MAELPSGTVTFLFTDIEGSTARWEHQPEAMGVALARHDTLLRAAIHDHHGHVVKTMGDAFHAAFARALDALAAALDAQRRLGVESWGETSDPRLHCVVTEEPWYLQTEALVSPHLTPDERWLHDRQGPGQYVQRVTYRYYRQKPPPKLGP